MYLKLQLKDSVLITSFGMYLLQIFLDFFSLGLLWQHESRLRIAFFLSISRHRNYRIIPSGFAKLSVLNMLIFTRAFFLRFPDHLIKLFEIKYSLLDKLTHSQTQLLVSNVAGKYRGFIYAHSAYNCAHRSRWTTPKDDERFRNLTRILRQFRTFLDK